MTWPTRLHVQMHVQHVLTRRHPIRQDKVGRLAPGLGLERPRDDDGKPHERRGARAVEIGEGRDMRAGQHERMAF